MISNISALKDTQKENYKELLQQRLPKLIQSFCTSIDNGNYTLDCKMFPIDEFNTVQEDETDYLTLRTVIVLTNNVTKERVSFNADLLNIPVFHELGFKIRGNYMQMLDIYERTKGWSFTINTKNGKEPPVICATAIGEYGKSVQFYYDKSFEPKVFFKANRMRKKSAKTPVSVFFRALTGMTNQELLVLFGRTNPHVVHAFSNDYGLHNSASCIERLAEDAFGAAENKKLANLDMKLRELQKFFFSKSYLNLGKNNRERFDIAQSFKHRAAGKVLGEDVVVDGQTFEKGSIMTTELCEKLDVMPRNSLKVSYNDKLFVLKKFTSFNFQCYGAILAENLQEFGLRKGTKLTLEELNLLNASDLETIKIRWEKAAPPVIVTRRTNAETLTQEDLFTAFSIWMDNINGFNNFDKEYELNNRVCITFDEKIYRYVDKAMMELVGAISRELHTYGPEESLLTVLSQVKVKTHKDDFIKELLDTNTKEGQMSDMCNIISYISKSNKATTDIDGDDVPSEMRGVQASQEGRLDPFDSPESKHIGLVHHKTLLSDVNEVGQVTSPYLEVKNGEVVSDKPVMLTAFQESGKKIAMWNETFKQEDGSKKEFVTARCDGIILSVKTDEVSYKEYSPLQGMSVTHGLMALANHSNGKRVTMWCNEATQILPTVNNPERPLLGTGVESIMDFGNYVAGDLLQSFYRNQVQVFPELKQYEQQILNSQLFLQSMMTRKDQRILTLTVVEVYKLNRQLPPEKKDNPFEEKITLTVPFLLRNFHNAQYSYRINHKADRRYDPTDVIAYSLGYSLEKKERKDLVDFGAYQVKEGTFDKGLAVGRNLVCGYKTFGTSTIEDSLTLSSRVVYDDTMTHLRLIMVEETLYSDDSVKEEFGNISDRAEYIQANGLPKTGTYLQPGDKVIGKVRIKLNAEDKQSIPEQEFKRLNMTQEGVVIRTEIIKKGSKGYKARVLLALRSSIENGDKMAGRCGNKGVVARIVPEWEMPYDPVSGLTLDICVNPLGVPSRQNISQLLEVAISMCRMLDKKQTYISPYHPDDITFIRQQIEEFNIHPVRMVDGRTGQYFKRPINLGVIYMSKLQQTVAGRVHAIGMDAPVDPAFLQPKRGSKNEGGQSFGEMENWCVHGVGANKLLNDFYGLQSDDVASRAVFMSKYLKRHAMEVPEEQYNNNCNDFIMKAYARSFGVEIVSDEKRQLYYPTPLTDAVIKSFSPIPVANVNALHSQAIFGGTGSTIERAASKQKWGWIDLNTEMVHPFWIGSGQFASLVSIVMPSAKGSSSEITKFFNKALMEDVIAGKAFIAPMGKPNYWLLQYPSENEKLSGTVKHPMDASCFSTGMEAIVKVIRAIDLKARKAERLSQINSDKYANDKEARKSDTYKRIIKSYGMIESLLAAGTPMENFIVTAFPVVPQALRMKLEHSTFSNTKPDLDNYYAEIIGAARKVKENATVNNVCILYNKIKDILNSQSSSNSKYKNISRMLVGKDDQKHHGKMREAAQSKRILCAGRAVISPASERIRPIELGVPAIMLIKMYQMPLIEYFSVKATGKVPAKVIKTRDWDKLFLHLANRNFEKFKKVYMTSSKRFLESFLIQGGGVRSMYQQMTDWLVEFFEAEDGRAIPEKTRPVVVCGRQPSLHRYSIRAFYPVVLWTRAIEINTMLCSGFNADFDGDMEWIAACLTEESKQEAIEKLSAGVDFINPKNSSIMLQHTQDIVLGCYVATMLKDNATTFDKGIKDIFYYSDVESLETDVLYGVIEPWDLVCLSTNSVSGKSAKYLSTAGRILFNSKVVGGFTDQEFSNTLKVEGVREERFRNLRYDGIITNGKGGNGELDYYNLSAICMDCFLENGKNCLDQYYDIEMFGFRMSDLISVTLSIDDMELESNKDSILEEAKNKKAAVERDFQRGLISEEDKNAAIKFIYSDKESGVQSAVMKDLIDRLPRNNNLFIMMDSGARGNATQITHMCGLLGILSKTKNDSMENPVTGNYFEGLTNFDVYMTSFSARVGVSSTQMETRNAGYASRKLIYATDGVSIGAKDCGKTNWWFECKWDTTRQELTKFYPTEKWLKGVGCIFSVDGQRNFNQEEILEKGFNTLETENGTVIASPELLRGSKPVGAEAEHLFGEMLKNGVFDTDCLLAFDHYKVKELRTSYGTITCRYKLTERCRSELMYREARGLKTLKKFEKPDGSDSMWVIVEKTLDEIERLGEDVIEARVMLDCECKNGVCAHCYGLKFSNLQIPEVGDLVGTETAQSIGEPAAQLTMNVINKGGVEGASLSSGVAVFNSYLNGTVIGGSDARVADVAERSGYARIKKMDSNVIVSVEPIDKSCEMCKRCQSQCEGCCPLETNSRTCDPLCSLTQRIPLGMLLVRNGEWVRSGEPITAYTPVADNIVSVDDSTDIALVLRKKQMVWIDNYFTIFRSQSININARHFELLALIQNKMALVTSSENPDFIMGKTYKVSDLANAKGVEFQMRTSKLQETILNNSGFVTALTFSNQTDVLKQTAFTSEKIEANSVLGQISIGQRVGSKKVKVLQNKELTLIPTEQAKPEQSIVYTKVQPFRNINLDDDEDEEDYDLFGEEEFGEELEDLTAFSDKEEKEDTVNEVDADESLTLTGEEEEGVLRFVVQYFKRGSDVVYSEVEQEGLYGELVEPDFGVLPDNAVLLDYEEGDGVLLERDGQEITFVFSAKEDIFEGEEEEEEEDAEEEEDVTLRNLNVF